MFGETWGQIAGAVWHGVVAILLNPLLYIGIGLSVWEVYRSGRHERRFFGARVTHIWSTVWRRYLGGLVMCLIVSIGLVTSGVFVSPWEVWTTFIVCIALGLCQVRWLSLPYGVLLVTLVSLLAAHVRPVEVGGVMATVWRYAANYHATAWVIIASAGVVAESILLWLMRNQSAAPTVVTSKRGRTIGAYLVHLGFVLPFITLAPGPVAFPTVASHWWPLMGHGASGFSMTGGVFLGGVSGVVSAQKPSQMARRMAVGSLVSGVVAGLAVFAAYRYNAWIVVVGAAALVIGREWPLWQLRRLEHRAEPMTLPSPHGVRVLVVQPGSLAETMGLRPGEVITQVNQIPVHTNYDLHFAMDQNPAYARLNVLDERGEVRIVGKPVYAGGKTKLGLILVPEGHERDRYMKPVFGLFHTLFLRLVRTSAVPNYSEFAQSDADPPTVL